MASIQTSRRTPATRSRSAPRRTSRRATSRRCSSVRATGRRSTFAVAVFWTTATTTRRRARRVSAPVSRASPRRLSRAAHRPPVPSGGAVRCLSRIARWCSSARSASRSTASRFTPQHARVASTSRAVSTVSAEIEVHATAGPRAPPHPFDPGEDVGARREGIGEHANVVLRETERPFHHRLDPGCVGARARRRRQRSIGLDSDDQRVRSSLRRRQGASCRPQLAWSRRVSCPAEEIEARMHAMPLAIATTPIQRVTHPDDERRMVPLGSASRTNPRAEPRMVSEGAHWRSEFLPSL